MAQFWETRHLYSGLTFSFVKPCSQSSHAILFPSLTLIPDPTFQDTGMYSQATSTIRKMVDISPLLRPICHLLRVILSIYKASDKAPTTGRLYHHLAILARPYAVKQLFYYTKSLCVAIPFKWARDSILTLFDPIINGTQTRL